MYINRSKLLGHPLMSIRAQEATQLATRYGTLRHTGALTSEGRQGSEGGRTRWAARLDRRPTRVNSQGSVVPRFRGASRRPRGNGGGRGTNKSKLSDGTLLHESEFYQNSFCS
jgi:hypothetical protein